MTQLGSKKSRRGCVQCKRRRVKCNEESPCNNCLRRGEDCSLAQPSPGNTRELRDSSIPSNTEEWVQEMELMHHYSSYVAMNPPGTSDQTLLLWKDVIPQEALRHPFLLHGLLALSALSLVYLRPTEAQKYMMLCDKHQNIAITAYRNILGGQINQEVSTSLFALASVISISSMARSCATASMMAPPQSFSTDDISELFYLTRGVRDVIHVAHDFIRSGPLFPMLLGHSMPPDMEPQVHLPPTVRAHFERIRSNLLIDSNGAPEELAACTAALGDLENIYCNVRYFARQGTVESGQVWRWQTMVPTEYVRLIQNRYPPALVILAHFATATAVPRDAWYTTRWGEYALQGISMALEENMQHWLTWPREQISPRLEVLIREETTAE